MVNKKERKYSVFYVMDVYFNEFVTKLLAGLEEQKERHEVSEEA